MKKRASIIVPAYNEENYLLSALESVERQNYDHERIEVIVVDNCSTDNTARVFQSFMGANTVRMTLLHEPVLGVSRAKNRGASASEGEILLFLDADSRMSENLVQVIDDHYQKGCELGIIKLLPDSTDSTARIFFRLIDFGKQAFRIAAHMGYCSREMFWLAGGFPQERRHAEDLELFTRIKKMLNKQGKKYGYIEEAHITTSTRRMDRLPIRLGYPLTLSEWFFGGMLGLGKRHYKPYR